MPKLAGDVAAAAVSSVSPSEADDRDLSRRRLVDGSRCFRDSPVSRSAPASKVARRCDGERPAEKIHVSGVKRGWNGERGLAVLLLISLLSSLPHASSAF